MNDFSVYFRLGFEHLIDIAGVDHILFLAALSIGFVWSEWKSVLFLITAFTVGHTTTLAVATLNIVSIDTNIVEILIPVTILMTCVMNVLTRNKITRKGEKESYAGATIYALTLLFGFIHGLGFSTFLRALLGAEENIVVPLLSFNIGLELGQIVLVVLFLFVTSACYDSRFLSRPRWVVIFSAVIGIASAGMILSRIAA